jgi:hypothetical protein
MIHITAIDETHLNEMGIYRIWFGYKYYIGATVNTFKRMICHNSTIKRCFDGHRVGKNSQTNVVKFLSKNQWITIAFLELIETVDYEEELVDAEQRWFDISHTDPNCLNEKFTSYRKVNGIEIRPTFVVC